MAHACINQQATSLTEFSVRKILHAVEQREVPPDSTKYCFQEQAYES